MAAETRHTAHVPEWKVKEVEELVGMIKKSRVVGIVGFREMPADNLQQLRGALRGNAEIKVVRNTIARRALESSLPDIGPLADFIEDQTALLFSEDNPFKLNALLERSKRPMPIKAGARAPKDIVVEAGETSFSPGPMVGKLQAAGIPAAIKIFPRNVGLELRAAYEGGLIFGVKDLFIDVDAQISKLSGASATAFSFAVKVGYATPQTIGPMLQKAQTEARALVLDAGLPVPGMMEMLLAKAAANAKALSRLASGETAQAAAPAAAVAASQEKAEEKSEEKKEEGDTAAGLGALFG